MSLWAIRGTKPVLWTLPIEVTGPLDNLTIAPAIPLRRKEQLALNAQLRNIRNADGTTTIYRLKAVAVAADGDPETYAFWHQPQRRDNLEQPKYQVGVNEWTDDLYQKGIGTSPAEVAAWWIHFRNQILDWLINKERAVDLGFIKLLPSCRRPSWPVSLLLSKEARKSSKFHYSLRRYLRTAFCTSLNPDGTVQRFVEVQHTRLWRKIVREVEQRRLKMLQPFKYAAMVAQSLDRTAEEAARFFEEWRRASLAPPGRFYECSPPGNMVLVPHQKIGPRRIERSLALSAHRRDLWRRADSRDPRTRKNALKELSRLRAAEQKNPNLRYYRRNVSKPMDRRGHLRLLVLHAPESQPQGSPLLAR